MVNLSPEIQKILREPFLPEQIGKLPRISCGQCRDAQFKVCPKHSRAVCPICKSNMTTAHIHLDYVGHAAVTDRLLRADRHWSWEPAQRNIDPNLLAAAAATGNVDIVNLVLANAPAVTDNRGGMWIKLTVGGVTRLGYGVDDDRGPDHDKKVISDAIRNAAMRFGVALDLWSKEDLSDNTDEPPPERKATVSPIRSGPTSPGGRDWMAEAAACTTVEQLLALGRECNQAGEFVGPVKKYMVDRRAELSVEDEAAG